jgi:DNA-binding transcriptional regulator YiaG
MSANLNRSGVASEGMENASAKSEVLARGRVHRLVTSDRLRELRLQRGLDQSDVARYLGVAASNVSRWEAGVTRPTGAHAVALLQLLDGQL